ncbi:MAG: metallophosphoesterase family protein [Candidatus Omnitrophica bacterium]|nr:metallophosphoesterase family protein [Candidatus Omnitrophota bacterium]
MRIGVLSDTHSRDLPKQMMEDFKQVDFIIHAGDFCSKNIFDELKKIKDVKAVYGNMDEKSLRAVLPKSQIVHCGTHLIGVFHGEGHPDQLLKCVKLEFANQKVDVATDTIFAPYRSYGILEVDGAVKGRIIKLDED